IVSYSFVLFFFFFQAEDGIRDVAVTGVQTCALPIYQFSEQYLGVDPLYYWTDRQPLRRTQLGLPASLNKQFPASVFKYRGLFINDEDLLTGWAPGEAKDHTGISLEVWNKIFETILRLKGDRKSTRLNSSHGYISYAVFCLKNNSNGALNNHRSLPPRSTTQS